MRLLWVEIDAQVGERELVGVVLEGRYRLEERLARGGMSTVYAATDLRLHRTVAVKVFWAGTTEDADAVRRESEKRLLASLDPLRRRLIQGFIVLMVAGQLYDRPGRIYPFVSWTMYSNATHPGQNVNRIRARLTDGRIEDLPICPFPIRTLNCAATLRLLAKKAADPDSKNPGRAKRRLDEFERMLRRDA